MNTPTQISLTQKAMQAMADAVAEVVEDHRRRARPLTVWRDGKAVWIPATDAGIPHDGLTPCHKKANRQD